MRLCYNSLLLTIYFFYEKELKLTDINDMLYRSIDDTFKRTSLNTDKEDRQKYASELKNGKVDIPKEMKKVAKSKSWNEILYGVNKYCSTLLKLSNNDELINVLNELIIESSNIETGDVIFENPNIKKINFGSVKMDFSEYLAKLLRYIFVNAIEISKVKKTGFDSCHTFTLENYEKLLESCRKAATSIIDISSLTTIQGEEDFNNTFHQLSHPIKLTSKEPNDLKIFYLDTDSNGLNYESLKDIIITNLGNYVYSKKHNQELISKEKYALIGIQALKEFKKSNVFNGDELGNILLYSFLEVILKAPKLFSNFEINKHKISSSNAIHIHTVSMESQKIPYNSLIFGTSNIEDDFKESITKTLTKLKEIKQNEENKYEFVNEAAFNSSFDYVNAEKLKQIILPSENKQSFAPSSFAIFIGYKVDINPDDYDSPQELSLAIQNKMKDDIVKNFEFIVDRIKESKLDKRSIYIYVLPFNDPTSDKSDIITSIINE